MQKRIHLAIPIPNKIIAACSGGCDSMATLDFLLNGKKDVVVAYFNHGTEHGNEAEAFVSDFCKDRNLELYVGSCSSEKSKDQSLEEYWREERLRWLEELSAKYNRPVVTSHHLDDAVEWWVFSSLHGNPKLIPDIRSPFIRPFLLTRKSTFKEWNVRRNVSWIEDPSNLDIKFMRNYIRHVLLPAALNVNPGIHKVVAKKLRE